MRPRLLLLTVALASLAAAWSLEPVQMPDTRPAISIDSPDVLARCKAISELLRSAREPRERAVSRLLAIVRANPQRSEKYESAPKALAIGALGELKAQEALEALTGEIGYRAPEAHLEVAPWDGRPCVRALIGIGFPAVTHLLKPATLRSAAAEHLPDFALVVRYVFPDAETARAFVAAYDPGYDAAAKAKHAQLQELLAKLP